jgi:hypothetical protein
MNNAIAAISSIDKGRAISELQEALSTVAKAVMDLRAKGEVTIKLTLKPSGDAIELAAKVSSKAPKPDLKPATFFVTDEGELSREDPNQPELPAVAQMTATK